MTLRGPQMLKDYLASDSNSNSCSSSGFRFFPRQSRSQTVRNLLEIDLNSSIKFTRSRSRAASATIYAVHRASEIFSNAVKFLPFNSVKSRRECCAKRREEGNSVTVRVKDILRWRSFGDLVEEESPPLDFCSTPLRCTTRSTTTSGSTSSTSGSSSWCESDFTAENLPFCRGERCSPEEVGGGGDSTVDLKKQVDLPWEEEEQNSPVSILNFPSQKHEESCLSFHQSLANLKRRKHQLIQNIQQFECPVAKLEPTDFEDQFPLDKKDSNLKANCGDRDENIEKGNGIGEKARQMLNHVKATRSVPTFEAGFEQLLLDFFSDELAPGRYQNNGGFEREILRVAKDWVGGQYEESFEWEMEGKREAYVRDMERGERWKKFEEEREELAVEVEVGVLDYLMDELLVDLFGSLKTRMAEI